MSHECPANGCTEIVGDQVFMCRADWERVPVPLQKAVYRAWNQGAGRGSRAHQAAMAAAIRAVNGEPEPARGPAPHELWEQAGGGTDNYDQAEYQRLMREHRHLLAPGDPGYDAAPPNLPCGWPGRQP